MKLFWFLIGLAIGTMGQADESGVRATEPSSHESVVSLVRAGHDSLAAGDKEKARGYAEAAVARDPGYADAWKLLGTIRLRSGDTNAATQAFRTALLISPRDAGSNRELGWLLWEGDREQAIAKLDVVIESGVADRDALIRRVLGVLAETGQEQRALDLIKRWKPSFSAGEFGVSLFEEGRRTAAFPFLDAAWRAGENLPALGLYLAVSEARMGKSAPASACLKTFLEKAPRQLPPGQSDVLWSAVTGIAKADRLAGLWGLIQERYPVEPDKRVALAMRFEEVAVKARRRSDRVSAVDFYRQAMVLDPDRACWADWVLLVERLSSTTEARHQLDLLLPRVTVPAIRDGMTARVAHYDGKIQEAITGYRASLAKIPAQKLLRVFLIRDLLIANCADDAREETRRLETLDQKGVSQDLAGQDRAEMAEFWFEVGEMGRAVELDRNLLVMKSRTRGMAGDWEGALQLATFAVTNDLANAAAWTQLGVAHFRLQNYPESRAALEQAIRLKPDEAAAQEALGWTLWDLGEREAARGAWDRAVGAGLKDPGRSVRQIVARMVEDGRKDWALESHQRWLPGTAPLVTGLDLFRGGRMKAAEPFLACAWDGTTGNERAQSGLYLGRVRTINGEYAGTPAYFLPYISSCLATAAAQDVVMVMDGLRLCSGVEGAGEALDMASTALAGRQECKGAVTDVYLGYASDDKDRGKLPAAFGYYQKALEREPDRLEWPIAWSLALRMNDKARGLALLSNLLDRATSVAVRSGVEAKLAECRGDLAAARTGYQKSLKEAPHQFEIHGDLFGVSMELGDVDQARREVDWMESRLGGGEVRYRDALASMLTELGEDGKALEQWQYLHLAMPDVGYYRTELAMAQYRTGHGGAAVETLKEFVAHTPTALGYELLVQMLSEMGRAGDAVQWAQQGLVAHASPVLRRTLAENLEAVDGTTTATSTLAAAQASLNDDPGSSAVSLLVGRALSDAVSTREAADWYAGLLNRNPDFVPSLGFLRDYEIVMEQPRRALPFAERLVAARPWDETASRRYAVTLAEADGFSRAIRSLERLAGRNDKAVTATLLYGSITPHDYAGMNSASQIVTHVAALAKEGYVFVTAIPAGSLQEKQKSVMMILLDPDGAVVEAVDKALQAHGACAVMIVNPDNLSRFVPRKVSPVRLAELRRCGRWTIGVSLYDAAPVPVRADGVKGNALTHRIVVNGVLESDEAMAGRVGASLARAASTLGITEPRYFYYPGGDYGQLSLDTDRTALNVLSNQVGKAFSLAFFRDDNGFIPDQPDRLRIPARVVPPGWDETGLILHLQQDNPVIKARLELAKLFYWHGQSEAASYWFRKAREAGANPFEVTFNEAANAAMSGDLPVALRKSREAVKLAPKDEVRPAKLLDTALDMRRPTVSLRGGAWWDNEDRSYEEIAGTAEGPLTDWLRWNAGVGRDHWEKKNLGSEEADQAELGFLAYVAPEVWVQAGLKEWFMDSLPDLAGWQAKVHLPNPRFRGHVELTSEREMMETVEALRKEITAHREGVELYSRIFDFWDCFINAAVTERSDGNSTWWAYGRLIRRLKETPYIGVGYAGRFADSTDPMPEYWSPEQLQQHQLYAAWQGTGLRWNGQLSGQAGSAKEQDTDWRFVWGVRAAAVYKVTTRLNTGADLTYQEGPVYNRTAADAFVTLRW